MRTWGRRSDALWQKAPLFWSHKNKELLLHVWSTQVQLVSWLGRVGRYIGVDELGEVGRGKTIKANKKNLRWILKWLGNQCNQAEIGETCSVYRFHLKDHLQRVYGGPTNPSSCLHWRKFNLITALIWMRSLMTVSKVELKSKRSVLKQLLECSRWFQVLRF